MTGYTPNQLLVALGKARAEANRMGATVHVVAKRTMGSLFTKRALRTDKNGDGDAVVIRDVAPGTPNHDMICAMTAALGHDPEKERIVLDMMRTVTRKPDGEAFTAEEAATIIWTLAENLEERDFQERRAAGYTRRVA